MTGPVERKLKAELAEERDSLRAKLEHVLEEPSLKARIEFGVLLDDYEDLYRQAYSAEVDGR